MAKPIVDGIPEQTNNQVEVIHLNLLTAVGREVGGHYGVRMVPATVLVDNQDRLVDQQSGRPNSNRLINMMVLAPEQVV